VPEAKPYDIPKNLIWEAYQRVKANRGAAGVDGESLEAFEKDLKGNLYKIWNRMSSGSYFPPPVRRVEIAKASGGTRGLGIPTVADRIAQTVVTMVLEPEVEPVFHPWELVERAVAHHTKLPWVRLYIARWLRAPVQKPDGTVEQRTKGTPQGGVASPLLANLFLHYTFDLWMQRNFPSVPFERYADDAIVHCKSERQAKMVLGAIRDRLAECGLELHPTKTRIVYCQDSDRRGKYEHISFDFLGYTFQPRRAKNHRGKYFVSFLPAISTKAAKAIRATIREWRLASTRNNQSLEDLAQLINPVVRGWMNYYGRYYRSKCVLALRHVNLALAAWARRKYRRFKRRERESLHWLGRIARRDPNLFVLWQLGIRPEAGS